MHVVVLTETLPEPTVQYCSKAAILPKWKTKRRSMYGSCPFARDGDDRIAVTWRVARTPITRWWRNHGVVVSRMSIVLHCFANMQQNPGRQNAVHDPLKRVDEVKQSDRTSDEKGYVSRGDKKDVNVIENPIPEKGFEIPTS